MKKYIDIKIMLASLFISLLALPFTSCEKDDGGGLPVIFQVRTTNPELKDSTFVKASPGQMILIEGENLGSVTKVYINDQEVPFNPNYVTSKSIILTIPAELPLTGTNPELPKEIRVENEAGSASYTFHVLSPVPIISYLRLEYPINPGDKIEILGENFYEIEKIIMEGQDENGEPTGLDVEITDYTYIGEEYEAIQFIMPGGVAKRGEVVLVCAAGEARIGYATDVMAPTIASISSDMPVIGSEFFITGTYFVGVKSVNINGEYDILAEDLRVSVSNDTIFLKLPAEPTASGIITVSAAGGNSNDNKVFYPKENVIDNFDDVGSIGWTGSTYEGNGTTPPYVTTGKAGGVIESNVSGWNYWYGNTHLYTVYTNAIPDDTPVANLKVRFECFITYPLQAVRFELMFGGVSQQGYIPVSVTSGITEIGKWMTCEVPLSYLAANAVTYSDVKALTAEMGFFSKNEGEAGIPQYEVFFDNIRIINQ